MNYKRIMSLLVLLALLMACTSVAFASSDADDIGQLDDFDLDDLSIYDSEDDFDDYAYSDDDDLGIDDDMDDDELDEDWYGDELDEDSDDDDWDDDSDYDEDESDDDSDDEDWDDDSDDEDWDDDSDYDDDWDDDSDYDDWDDDSDYDDDWDDEDWDDDYYYDEDSDMEYSGEYETLLSGNASGSAGYFKNKTLIYYKTDVMAKTTSFLATSLPNANTNPKESDASEENQTDDNTNETAEETLEKTTAGAFVDSAMPVAAALSDVMDNHVSDLQSSYPTENPISKVVDSSKITQNKHDIAKKVAKTQLDNNYGILAIIVVLLICFALGYKKFN